MSAPIRNYVSASRARVAATKDTPVERFQAQLAEVKHILATGPVYGARANLNGIIVELRTNVRHQFEFWLENWWAMDVEIRPHATLYSVNGVAGEEPHAYYCHPLRSALFVNTEYYGQCKSWALGMAAAILEKQFHTHSMHGALAMWRGKGVVIIAPTGTGKTTQAFKLFLHPEGRIVGDDWVYVTFPDPVPSDPKPALRGVQPERSLYMRTETEMDQAWLRPIFDDCPLENVVERKDVCEFTEGATGCQLTKKTCVFDQGLTHCYYSFGNARALVLRERLRGPEYVADEAPIRLVVLLRRDSDSPAAVELSPDEAIEVLRKGEYQIRPGAGRKEEWGKMGSEPWYNPYLLAVDHVAQEYYFRLMFEVWGIPCLLLNTGVETVEQTHQRILRALKDA